MGLIVDVHCHYAGPWPALPPFGTPPGWDELARRIGDLDGVLAAMDATGIDMRVLSAPPALVGPVDRAALNEHLAARVAAHPDRLLALATVDAFAGDAAAREVERAARDLGLSGICVDCAGGEDEYLDAPSARPALATAAALGLPVFVHPTSPPDLSAQLARFGGQGQRLARATAAGAGVLALLGVLDALPGLRVIVPLLGAGVLLLPGLASSAPAIRRQLYVDTMGFDPAAIRFAAGVVGDGHVLVGTDWPVPRRDDTRERIEAALAASGLPAAAQAQVSGGSALDLLGVC